MGDDPFEGIDTESEFRFKPKTDFDDVKTKKVEFAIPIALDRPNTLRINNRQGLFRFSLKVTQLPLYFSIVGNAKTQLKSFISFTSLFPDHDSFDVSFDGGIFALRYETLRNSLEEMLKDKDKTKQEEMENIIRGGASGKSESSRRARGTFLQPAKPDRHLVPDDGMLSTDDHKGATVLVTAQKDHSRPKKYRAPIIEQPLLQRVLQDEKGLQDVVIPLTIRVYSTSKVIVLTVSGKKQNTKRVEKIRVEDLFSTHRAEEINKSIVHTTLEIRKMEGTRTQGLLTSTSSTFGSFNKRQVELVEGPDGKPVPVLKKQPSERIMLNKRIAREYMNFRLTHFSLLARKNASEVALHQEKANIMRKEKKDQLELKLEAADLRREEERTRRVEREYLSRIIPLKANWIVLLRFGAAIQVIQDRFLSLKKHKLKMAEQTRKAVVIQSQIRKWFDNTKPPRTSDWRFLDAKLHLMAQAVFSQDHVITKVRKTAKTFLHKCLPPILLRHSCLQFVLYGKSVKARFFTYQRNQQREVDKLRRLWSEEASNMMKAEAIDKSLSGLQGLTLVLQNLENQDE